MKSKLASRQTKASHFWQKDYLWLVIQIYGTNEKADEKTVLLRSKHANLAKICVCVCVNNCGITANPEEYKNHKIASGLRGHFWLTGNFLKEISTFTGEREEKTSTAATGKWSHSCFSFPPSKKPLLLITPAVSSDLLLKKEKTVLLIIALLAREERRAAVAWI